MELISLSRKKGNSHDLASECHVIVEVGFLPEKKHVNTGSSKHVKTFVICMCLCMYTFKLLVETMNLLLLNIAHFFCTGLVTKF